MTDGNRDPAFRGAGAVTDWVQAAGCPTTGEKKPAEAGFQHGLG
ncbi:hypothetical protein [Limnohabitans sp. Bal53]|nr:hypothetical protein [Limnohabitans sp. Bal53]